MSLYGCFSELLFTAARPFLNKKYDEGNEQRYGYYNDSIPQRAVWIHAVSVGEVQTAYPFVKVVTKHSPHLHILLSTITKTGRQMSEQLMGKSVERIYYPWDAPSVLKRALNTLRPSLYIAVETEIWPEMLLQLEKRRIPSFLLNGRLSEASFIKFNRFRAFWKNVVRRYTLILTRSEEERERFIKLGAAPELVKVTGDCKVDALIERRRAADLSGLTPYFSEKRPVVLAGSTHHGEETIVFQAYTSLKMQFPDLQLVIVPRHPERAASVVREAQNLGIKKVFLMSDKSCRNVWDVMVVDRIGVLFPAYGCVRAAFLGGSLVPKGGQNIMEPAIWGIPCCQGPDYHDFTKATEELKAAGLCKIVHSAAEMADFFADVLKSDETEKYLKSSAKFFSSMSGASERSWDLIGQHLHKAV